MTTWKDAARVASTGDVNLSTGHTSIDGVNLNAGDRVLLKDQVTASQNGVYVATGTSPFTLARSTDTIESEDVVRVSEGRANAKSEWVLTTPAPITLGTTALGFEPIRATPTGWYDPRHYGAALDGVSDDLPAFQAMHAAMPATGGRVHLTGMAYFSDTWRVSKPINLHGFGGTWQHLCGIEVAPGKTAMTLDPSTISLDGNSAQSHFISRLDLKSKLLIHPTANGSALGYGLPVWSSGGTARKGGLFVASGGASPTRCFRVTDTGAGTSAGTFGTVEPAWNTTVGGTTTTNGMTLTTEALPTVRANSTTYAVGDRVFADKDNRYVFRCTATTTGVSAASPPGEMQGDTSAYGVEVGATVTDGGVTWTVELAAGIYVRSGLGTIEHIYADGFTGAAIHVQGGDGQDILGSTNADNPGFSAIVVIYCGLGMFIGGDDTNGYEINRLWGTNIGTLLPTPDAAAATGYTGLGGHILHDHSEASGECHNLYAQLSSGRPVLKTGLGRATFVSCYSEVTGLSYSRSVGYATTMGGSLSWTADSNVSVFDSTGSRAVHAHDNHASNGLSAYLDFQDGSSVLGFTTNDESGNRYSWQYGYGVPTGYWGLNYGNQGIKTALWTTAARTFPNPGAGWVGFDYGHFFGNGYGVDPLMFDGVLTALPLVALRGGARNQGDRFRGVATDVRVLAGGYRAPAWTPNAAAGIGYAPWSIHPTIVSPTATPARREGGAQVWKCTTAGTTGSTEPAWPSTPTPGVTTQSDGTAVWTFLGFTPAYDVDQRVEKTKRPTRLLQVQTTTAAANQVLVDGAVVDGIDLALPDNAVVRITDVLLLHKPGTSDGGTITVESDWARNGAGPVQLGSTIVNYNLAGISTEAALTVAHAANGNRIELRVSPQTAETLNWRVRRAQIEGVD